MENKKPVTDRHRELLGMPPIHTHFPVSFENGRIWQEFYGHCSSCGEVVNQDLLRGSVVRHGESMAAIEAVGACTDCRVLSVFHVRMHDDMRITSLQNGKWQTWRVKITLMDRIKHFLGMHISGKIKTGKNQETS